MTTSSTPTHLPFLCSFWSFLISFSTIFTSNTPLFHIKNAQIICLKNHLHHLIAGTCTISAKLCRPNRNTIAFLPANNHMQLFEFASFFHSTPSACHRQCTDAFSLNFPSPCRCVVYNDLKPAMRADTVFRLQPTCPERCEGSNPQHAKVPTCKRPTSLPIVVNVNYNSCV
jgi:hypothetical protein